MGSSKDEWRKTARCRGIDTSIFFPGSIVRPAARDAAISKATAICARCDHRKPCLEEAKARGEREGIWGGVLLDGGPGKAVQRPGGVWFRASVPCRCDGCQGPILTGDPYKQLVTSKYCRECA